jgi:hypothetical protein
MEWSRMIACLPALSRLTSSQLSERRKKVIQCRKAAAPALVGAV